VVPETIVVDRGKVFVSGAFTAACETLGISVQPAPPFAPTAKGIVEHTNASPTHTDSSTPAVSKANIVLTI
jgi:hypothetical protein